MAMVSEKEGSHVKVSMGPLVETPFMVFQICTLLFYFFFLRSLLIGYKFYLSGVQVNTVWLLSHRNVILKNFNILNIFILA